MKFLKKKTRNKTKFLKNKAKSFQNKKWAPVL